MSSQNYNRLVRVSVYLLFALSIGLGQACSSFRAPSGGDQLGSAAANGTNPAATTPNSSNSNSPAVNKGTSTCDFNNISISNHRTEVRSVSVTTSCLTVQNASSAAGNAIINYDCSMGLGAPLRPVLQFDDCSFQLQTLPINGVLCLDSGSGADVGLVQQNCDSTAATQRWLLSQNPDATYRLKTRDNRCIEMMGTATDVEQIHVKTCDGSAAQNFTLAGLATAMIEPAATAVTVSTPPPTFATNLTYVRLTGDMVSSSVGMTSAGTGQNIVWSHPQQGAYIEYPLTVVNGGNYSLQMVYGAWMANAGVNVSINGSSVGFMSFPITDQDTTDYAIYGTSLQVAETQAFPVKLTPGLNVIRLSVPDSLIPFETSALYVSFDGQELVHAGAATPISATGLTNFDIATINRIYRFTLDDSLGVMAWRYPHSVAHIEYKINVTVAGKYSIVINYSSPTATESVDVISNGPLMISAGYTAIANIPFASTGATIGTFVNSTPVVVDLPAGVSRLDFAAHSTPTWDFAIAGISVAPAP